MASPFYNSLFKYSLQNMDKWWVHDWISDIRAAFTHLILYLLITSVDILTRLSYQIHIYNQYQFSTFIDNSF